MRSVSASAFGDKADSVPMATPGLQSWQILCQIPPSPSAHSLEDEEQPGWVWSVWEEQDTSIAAHREFPPRADSQEGKSSFLRVESFDALGLQGILSRQPCPCPQENI